MIDLNLVIRPIMWCTTKMFFKNILVQNANRVPYNKPVILASNHPNSLVDPIVIGLTLPRNVYFLARGDVFNSTLKGKLLNSFHVLPIFRKEDTQKNYLLNQKTFIQCNKLLKQNKSILIFSEGFCIQEKKLRPLKKGTARMAIEAMEFFDYNLDVQIVPVSINYSQPVKFRSDLVISFGNAISVTNYLNEIKESKSKASILITRELESSLKQELIIINERDFEEFAMQSEEICKEHLKDNGKVNFESKVETFGFRKQQASEINNLVAKEPVLMSDLRSDLKHYFTLIEQKELRDYLLNNEHRPYSMFFVPLLLLITFPLFAIGALLHFFPFYKSYSFAKKLTRQMEFFASVMLPSAGLMYFLLYILFFGIINALSSSFIQSLFVFAMIPILGIFSIHHWRWQKKIRGMLKYNRYLKSEPNEMKLLRETRSNLQQRLTESLFKRV